VRDALGESSSLNETPLNTDVSNSYPLSRVLRTECIQNGDKSFLDVRDMLKITPVESETHIPGRCYTMSRPAARGCQWTTIRFFRQLRIISTPLCTPVLSGDDFFPDTLSPAFWKTPLTPLHCASASCFRGYICTWTRTPWPCLFAIPAYIRQITRHTTSTLASGVASKPLPWGAPCAK
jgi:hypothetical protein